MCRSVCVVVVGGVVVGADVDVDVVDVDAGVGGGMGSGGRCMRREEWEWGWLQQGKRMDWLLRPCRVSGLG